MIGFVREQPNPDLGVLISAGATLILALAVLVIRFTSARYPSYSFGEITRTGRVHDERGWAFTSAAAAGRAVGR